MTYAVPILFVVLMWWFSTGAVLWAADGNAGKRRSRLIWMTVLCAMGFAGVYASAHDPGAATPYLGFVSALAIWGWVEFTFLSGMLTGPRSAPCPQDISEARRFRLAFATISHHEFALVLALAGIALISLPGGHMMAFATFLLLWLMRISAKLTLFSGAPRISTEMMPERLKHMESYFRRDRVGPVFWVSTALSTGATAAAVWLLATGAVEASLVVPAIMLTTLLTLAVLEHLFMVLPVSDGALWRWAMPVRIRQDKASGEADAKVVIDAAE